MTLHSLPAALLLLLTGCSALRPVKDVSVHHLLDATIPDRTLTSETPAVAVKRTSLPSYLDRTQLVTRLNGTLVMNGVDLWGEPLDAAIARVTASNLSRLTGSMNIQPVQYFTTLDYATLLELNVSEFEPEAGDQLVLQGTWKLQPVDGREARTHFFHIKTPIPATPDSMSGRVTAMNQALERLARQIVGFM